LLYFQKNKIELAFEKKRNTKKEKEKETKEDFKKKT